MILSATTVIGEGIGLFYKQHKPPRIFDMCDILGVTLLCLVTPRLFYIHHSLPWNFLSHTITHNSPAILFLYSTVTCGHPPHISNAVVTVDKEGHSATYSCHHGHYRLIGDATITCVNGKWLGKEIHCSGKSHLIRLS